VLIDANDDRSVAFTSGGGIVGFVPNECSFCGEGKTVTFESPSGRTVLFPAGRPAVYPSPDAIKAALSAIGLVCPVNELMSICFVSVD
jgi:hypothetical protein